MNEYTDFLKSVDNRLNDGQFRISREVHLLDGLCADLIASRTYFSWKGLVLLSQHLVISKSEKATVEDLQRLFEAGFNHAKKVNRIPLLRGMQFGYMIVPCIATTQMTDYLRSYVATAPRKHWSIFEFPIIHDLNIGETHYFRGTVVWGSFFFSDLRSVVARYIESRPNGNP